MMINIRYRQLIKHLAEAIKNSKSQVPVYQSKGAERGIGQAEYEDYLLQKLFFRRGKIYLKVFHSPNELTQAIAETLALGLIVQDEFGFLRVGPRGTKYLHPFFNLLHFLPYLLLLIAIAGAGFGLGAGISSWWY